MLVEQQEWYDFTHSIGEGKKFRTFSKGISPKVNRIDSNKLSAEQRDNFHFFFLFSTKSIKQNLNLKQLNGMYHEYKCDWCYIYKQLNST